MLTRWHGEHRVGGCKIDRQVDRETDRVIDRQVCTLYRRSHQRQTGVACWNF